MFSLIITIISIALVAALALATLYYGGDAFKRGAASADATKLHVQAQQLQGAAELYKADTGAYPLTMEAMLTGNYLKSIPVSSLNPGQDPEQRYGAAPALMAQASAAGVVWKMVLAGQPVFAMTQVSVAVCEAVNMKAYGISGVLKSARAGYSTQCFGPDLANLTMVTTKSGAALITASLSPLATVSLGTVLTTAPPAVNSGDTTAAGWLTVEGVTVAAVTPAAAPLSFSYDDDEAARSVTNHTFTSAEAGQDWRSSTYFLVRNTSATPVTFTGTPFSSTASFIVVWTDCSGVTLAPGGSCEVGVAFSPALAQGYSGTLTAQTSQGAVAGLALAGTGLSVTATCPLTPTRDAGYNGWAGFVNNTGAPITLTKHNGFLDVYSDGTVANYYFITTGLDVGDAQSVSLPDLVEGIVPWSVDSGYQFEQPVVLMAGGTIVITFDNGPQEGLFKMGLYVPAENVWCGLVATNPDGYYGIRPNSAYTPFSVAGAAWAPPGWTLP